jgi:hypothetical protein
VAKKRSSYYPSRSRITPMNHRKAMPANGRRYKAREIVFGWWIIPVGCDSGLGGMEIRKSRKLVMAKREKRMPATAAARGVFISWRIRAAF